MKVKYQASVYLPRMGQWRNEEVTAIAEKISEKRCRIVEVLDIGGNGTCGYASRTGSKRQVYHVGGVAEREVGKIKNVRNVDVLEFSMDEGII